MYVYGIRCSFNDLSLMPPEALGAHADFYIDYGLLVFHNYTKSTCVNAHKNLTPAFWKRVRKVTQYSSQTHCDPELEHPYLEDEEYAFLSALQEFYPGISANWYYVPHVVNYPLHEENENLLFKSES